MMLLPNWDAPNADSVQDSVEATNLGRTLQITVNRNGSTRQLTLKPEQLPSSSR